MVGTERAFVDSAPNLKQEIGAISRPAHLLGFVHPTVRQEIGGSFGDRGSNSQSGTMPFGVIDQPVALAGKQLLRFGKSQTQSGDVRRSSGPSISKTSVASPSPSAPVFANFEIQLTRPLRRQTTDARNSLLTPIPPMLSQSPRCRQGELTG